MFVLPACIYVQHIGGGKKWASNFLKVELHHVSKEEAKRGLNLGDISPAPIIKPLLYLSQLQLVALNLCLYFKLFQDSIPGKLKTRDVKTLGRETALFTFLIWTTYLTSNLRVVKIFCFTVQEVTVVSLPERQASSEDSCLHMDTTGKPEATGMENMHYKISRLAATYVLPPGSSVF